MKRIVLLGVALLPLVVGCAALQGDPVPPRPALVGVQAQDRAWTGGIERSPESGELSFEPLTRARAAVDSAHEQPQVSRYSAEALRAAEEALAKAESGWNRVAGQNIPAADTLATVAHSAHRAQRLAEIARYGAIREINLARFQAIEQDVERQRGSGGKAGGSENLVGQQVIPDRLGEVAFEPGTARLTAASQDIVRSLAELLQQYSDFGVAISGHTDNASPSASTLTAFVDANPGLEQKAPTQAEKVRAFNLALSAARARAVARQLVDYGVSASRIGARGFGDARPVAGNDTPAGRDANRRVTAVIVPDPEARDASATGGS